MLVYPLGGYREIRWVCFLLAACAMTSLARLLAHWLRLQGHCKKEELAHEWEIQRYLANKKRPPLRPYNRNITRTLWWSLEGGGFFLARYPCTALDLWFRLRGSVHAETVGALLQDGTGGIFNLSKPVATLLFVVCQCAHKLSKIGCQNNYPNTNHTAASPSLFLSGHSEPPQNIPVVKMHGYLNYPFSSE